jgi:tetratricopeptide (TPR) repeat protein
MKFYITLLIIFSLFSCGPNENTLYDNGISLLSEGKFEEAVFTLEKVIELNPINAKAHNAIGVAYFETKKYGNALKYYSEAILRDSSDYKYFYNRANAKKELLDLSGSLTDYRKALTLKKDVEDIYLNRAAVYFDLKDYEGAMKDLEQVLNLKQGHPYANFNIGKIALVLNNYDLAINHFNKTLQILPQFSNCHYLLGLALVGSGRVNDACFAFQTAKEFGNESAESEINKHCI